MARLNPAYTSLKTLNITYQTPKETLLATPVTLPTSEPATPQIGYTVSEVDLPALSMGVYRKKWVAIVIGAGKFVTGGALYWRMKKNGVSVASGSAYPGSNYYYTVEAFFYDVAVGDLLELALWSSVSDSNWDYKAFQIQVTRLIPINKPRLLSPCNFGYFPYHPNLTLGNPYATTGSTYIYHCDIMPGAYAAATAFDCLYPKDTYGLFRIYYGDYVFSNTATVLTSTTYRPYYYRNYVPTQIIMRGVKTD